MLKHKFSGKRRAYIVTMRALMTLAALLTAALVLFIIDTVALVVIAFALYDSPMGKLVDFLLHIWAIVELIQAVRGSKKLRALPPTEEPRNVCTGPEF